ncbi:MAG: LPS export ABC transporter periplasmic protein LptC [bacterium]|nr:LPS export ABC transporter periplasmic protein LptC [bacterium]
MRRGLYRDSSGQDHRHRRAGSDNDQFGNLSHQRRQAQGYNQIGYVDDLCSHRHDLTIQGRGAVFDSSGTHTSTLTADSSRVSQRASTMSVFGNVKAWTQDNRRLVADSLRWNAKTELIETEGYVEIYRGEDMISGYGLETDQRLEHTTIKRQPKGTFSEPD